MTDFLTQWFQGFEQGINNIDQEEKEKFFSKCGRNCVESGVIKLYQDLYNNSEKKLDVFFGKLNELESIGGTIISAGKIYEISFPHCVCSLHRLGYVHSDYICECSRQSILYVMKSLEPELDIQVTKITTILGGEKECRFRIMIN